MTSWGILGACVEAGLEDVSRGPLTASAKAANPAQLLQGSNFTAQVDGEVIWCCELQGREKQTAGSCSEFSTLL